MKHWLILCVLLQATATISAADKAAFVYGHTNLDIPSSNYKKVATLLAALDTASPAHKREAIGCVIAFLKKTQEATDAAIEQHAANTGSVVPAALFFKRYITRYQIAYLENLYNNNQIAATDSLFARAKQWASSVFCPGDHTSAEGRKLATQIIDYIGFEREHILQNYKSQLLFFTSTQKAPLPEAINFWSQPETKRTMYTYAQLCNQQVVPQFGIDSIIEFAVQGILMAANSMAIEWVEEEDAKRFAELQTEQNKIQDEWTTFVTETKNQSQKIMNNVLAHFKTSVDAVQKSYEVSSQVLQRELEYLSRSLSLAQPKNLFLADPLAYDLAFQAAPMNTPKPHVWYNVPQIGSWQFAGDWEFDLNTNSFWQNGLQLYTSASTAELNTIFTEAIINGSSYEVEVECTLYAKSGSPFFMGIMFNKARWLSGDPERLTGYRLLGLYGIQQDKKTTVDAVFAEQLIIPEKDPAKRHIISPLRRVETQPTTHFATNVITDTTMLGVEPLTFTMHVITKPDEVTCTISHKEKPLAQKTITGLNKYVFIYHGVGFMAPGCQASFKIIKPTQLVYTQEQLQEYRSSLTPQQQQEKP